MGFVAEPATSNLLMQVGQFRCGTRALAVFFFFFKFWISLDSVLPFLSELYTKYDRTGSSYLHLFVPPFLGLPVFIFSSNEKKQAELIREESRAQNSVAVRMHTFVKQT